MILLRRCLWIVRKHLLKRYLQWIMMLVMRGDIARLGRCTAICTQGEDTIRRSKPFKYAYEKEIVMCVLFHLLLLYVLSVTQGMHTSRNLTTFRRSVYTPLMHIVAMLEHSWKTSRLQDQVQSSTSSIQAKHLKWRRMSRRHRRYSVSCVFPPQVRSADRTIYRDVQALWIHVE